MSLMTTGDEDDDDDDDNDDNEDDDEEEDEDNDAFGTLELSKVRCVDWYLICLQSMKTFMMMMMMRDIGRYAAKSNLEKLREDLEDENLRLRFLKEKRIVNGVSSVTLN